MSRFLFLDQHPTITRIVLGSGFTLAVQPPPNLLPNLRFIKATPTIIGRLILGRPVSYIHTIYSDYRNQIPLDIMLQPLRQPFVPCDDSTRVRKHNMHVMRKAPAPSIRFFESKRYYQMGRSKILRLNPLIPPNPSLYQDVCNHRKYPSRLMFFAGSSSDVVPTCPFGWRTLQE